MNPRAHTLVWPILEVSRNGGFQVSGKKYFEAFSGIVHRRIAEARSSPIATEVSFESGFVRRFHVSTSCLLQRLPRGPKSRRRKGFGQLK